MINYYPSSINKIKQFDWFINVRMTWIGLYWPLSFARKISAI